MVEKLIYCGGWSIALFVSTFYAFFETSEAFSFTDKQMLDVTKSHIMPMIMVMALYLWDVVYALYLHHVENNEMIKILLSIIAFLLFFVFSMLLNCNTFGWFLFILAWFSLTYLKVVTTEEVNAHKISED